MPQLADQELVSFSQQVQHNCTISDARYARDYSLCVYLLRMREFYRWHQDIPLTTAIDTDEVGHWISKTELAWEDLEDQDYQQLQLHGRQFDPFDSHAINASLDGHNLVYSARIGRMGQAHFFLAALNNSSVDQTSADLDMAFFECGTEYARDSITLPAMAQGQSVYIRHDSLSRMLWQMIDEWQLNPRAGPMSRLLQYFNIADGKVSDRQLADMATKLSWVVREHERGEVLAGQQLGSEWSTMAEAFVHNPGEYYVRAVRDMIADTLHSWPAMIAAAEPCYLDFWLAGVSGVREKWLNQNNTLALLEPQINDKTNDKTNDKINDDQLQLLSSVQSQELQRWTSVASTLKQQFRLHGTDFTVLDTVNELLTA